MREAHIFLFLRVHVARGEAEVVWESSVNRAGKDAEEGVYLRHD